MLCRYVYSGTTKLTYVPVIVYTDNTSPSRTSSPSYDVTNNWIATADRLRQPPSVFPYSANPQPYGFPPVSPPRSWAIPPSQILTNIQRGDRLFGNPIRQTAHQSSFTCLSVTLTAIRLRIAPKSSHLYWYSPYNASTTTNSSLHATRIHGTSHVSLLL